VSVESMSESGFNGLGMTCMFQWIRARVLFFVFDGFCCAYVAG
jgi:hypothetical protein